MERASLRPVPLRPRGPVEPADALAHVSAALPDLDEAARQALALVDLVGRSRPELLAEPGISADDLAAALARARKALRRAAFPLPGTGWCERAERLLSDELDGELVEPGTRRLAVHLANCERCVEHERRLRQARDRLVSSFDESRAALVPAADARPEAGEEPDSEAPEQPDPPADPPAIAPAPERAELDPAPPRAALEASAPELRLVNPPTAETPTPGTPEPADPTPADPPIADPAPSEPEPVEPPPAAAEPPAAEAPEPLTDEPIEPASVASLPPTAEPTEPTAEPTEPTAEPTEPAAFERVAAAAPTLTEPAEAEGSAPPLADVAASALPTPRFSLAAMAWTALLALAVLLALASLALTGYAIAGGSL